MQFILFVIGGFRDKHTYVNNEYWIFIAVFRHAITFTTITNIIIPLKYNCCQSLNDVL